jgi:hypothetical protein
MRDPRLKTVFLRPIWQPWVCSLTATDISVLKEKIIISISIDGILLV